LNRYKALKLRKSYLSLLNRVIGSRLETAKAMSYEVPSNYKTGTSPSISLDTTKAVLEEYAEMKVCAEHI
jgi:hypothetical protein